MKKISIISLVVLLAGCGAIGIGRNDTVYIHNASDGEISTVGTGISKIAPNSGGLATGRNIQIVPKDRGCESVNVPKDFNTAAFVLNIFPGILLGVIPMVVDAIAGGLNTMPKTYMYKCI